MDLPQLADVVRSAPKFRGTYHRIVSPSETCRRMAPIAERIGVTRIADITGLDRLGIPTHSSIRPLANMEGSISVTCGKGTSHVHARAGAIMEAIEYYCCERGGGLRPRSASFEELSRTERVLDPVDLVLPVWSPYRPNLRMEWLPSIDLQSGETWWLPANVVFHPYLPSQEFALILRGSTNGLASGNTVEEAICHALAELIERDAYSECWVHTRYGDGDRYPGLTFDGAIAPELAWLLSRFDNSGVQLFLRDISSELGLPVYYAGTMELVGSRYLLHEGMGCHLDPTIALSRAITEAAQSRAADIQGSREDLAYWRLRAGEWTDTTAPKGWSISTPAFTRPFTANSIGHFFTDVRDDIAWMVKTLAENGLPRVLFVDMTHPDIEVPVVRVVVPGLEFCVNDEYRVGPRARRWAESTRTRVNEKQE